MSKLIGTATNKTETLFIYYNKQKGYLVKNNPHCFYIYLGDLFAKNNIISYDNSLISYL